MLRVSSILYRASCLSLVMLSLLWPSFSMAQGEGQPAVVAPGGLPSSPDLIQGIMDRMSVEEKVGQLFLVTFIGSDVAPDSDIAELIQEYHVGGVVFLASNRNFTNEEPSHGRSTPRQVAELTNGLQRLAFTSSQGVTGTVPVTSASLRAEPQAEGSVEPSPTVPITNGQPVTVPAPHIPLFIAIDHEGDGYPYTHLRGGVTAVPSNMALGATWNEENAEKVGQIVGRELGAMGINLLFGPSLDVLDNPKPGLKGDMGIRTFGGDPYWVGRFGQAFIRGLHEGSGGRVLSVAKHFPGRGGSDRRADEEIATVPKSLQELRKIELAPFFAVAQFSESDPLATADALMSSHIRYWGFQDNIRQLTRPISFDAQNLQALLAEPELQTWRERGGVMITDALGVLAVRKYYDPQLQTFPHKRIAQEAFLAGNDLLVLSRFALTDDWPQQFENIKDTIRFFREKYVSDPTFQTRVDDSLERILRLKHQSYPDFPPKETLVDVEKLGEEVGISQGEISQIAQEAVTLISPKLEELGDRLPSPPLIDEDILIFTDAREARDCPDCQPFHFIEPDALQRIMLQLYGPEASGQVDPAKVHSLTFTQLRDFLLEGSLLGSGEAARPPAEAREPMVKSIREGMKLLLETMRLTREPTREGGRPALEATDEPLKTGVDIGALIEETDWIIFAMLDVNLDDYPESDTVKLFLKERSDSLRGKKVVVMAYNAPYYLDTTEISKLTAYYSVYSKVQPFIESSVRSLFQEFRPQDAPPVSVKGINYDLRARLEPDPDQVIGIEVTPIDELPKLGQEGSVSEETPTAIRPEVEGTPAPVGVEVGVTMLLRTSVILDRNGHPVPEGTPVVFRLFYPAESLELPRQEVATSHGVAEATITLERTGQLEITASSDPAFRSTTVLVTIEGEDEPATIATVVPTPTSTPTLTLTPTFTSPPTPTGSAMMMESEPRGEPRVIEADLLFSVGSMFLAGGVSYLLRRDWRFSQTRRLRLFLTSLIWGLVGYILYGLGFPGMGMLWDFYGHWGASLVCFLFGLIPLSYTLWGKTFP